MEATLVHPGGSRHHVLLQAGGPKTEGQDGPDRRVPGDQLAHESARVSGHHQRQGAHGVRRHHGGSRAVGDGLEPTDHQAQGEGAAASKSPECQVW